MQRATNQFRRCSYCPHSAPRRACCCQSALPTRKPNHKSKSRPRKPIDASQSTLSYINTTLPITNANYTELHSSILAHNSILRTENDYLKRQLHQHANPVSAFCKDDRNVSTFPTSENDTSRTIQLHDKLYLSNRNLQETLIEMDVLSRNNKDLNEANTKLEIQKQQHRIKCDELIDENERLKRKIRKLNKMMENYPSEEEVRRLVQVNCQLEKDKNSLREEIQELRSELARNRHTVVEVENLSPEWVANTSTKINAIERNLTKLQEENKENLTPNQSLFIIRGQEKQLESEIASVRRQLVSAIKMLKLHSQSFKVDFSAYDEIMQNSSFSIILLIKNLCESLAQPMQVTFIEMYKDLDRRIKNFEGRFLRIVNKMQNLVMKVNNSRLKERGRGGSIF